jgi:hypothetical protein
MTILLFMDFVSFCLQYIRAGVAQWDFLFLVSCSETLDDVKLHGLLPAMANA